MTDYLDEIQARAHAAHAEVVRLCNGPDAGRWRMTIPANPSRDSDLLIGDSLADVPRLVAFAHAVLALTYASDDGSEFEHSEGCDGQSECGACWAADIRRVADQHLGRDR